MVMVCAPNNPLFVQNQQLHKKGVEFFELLCKAPYGDQPALDMVGRPRP
jgi:hypothetical protein